MYNHYVCTCIHVHGMSNLNVYLHVHIHVYACESRNKELCKKTLLKRACICTCTCTCIYVHEGVQCFSTVLLWKKCFLKCATFCACIWYPSNTYVNSIILFICCHRYYVSNFARDLLSRIHYEPVFNVQNVNPKIYEVPILAQAKVRLLSVFCENSMYLCILSRGGPSVLSEGFPALPHTYCFWGSFPIACEARC